MNRARLLLTGSALRFISLLANIAISLFLMPFVIHALGDRWYGLWIIVGTLISYYSFLDLGLSSATQRFFARAVPGGDHGELNTIFNSSLGVFSALGAAGLLATVLISTIGPMFLQDSNDTSIFRIVILLMGVSVSLAFPFHVLTGLLTANLRYDQVSYLQLAKLILRSSLIVIVLRRGHSIVALAVVTVIVDVLGYLVLTLLATKAAPWMRLRREQFSLTKAREFFGFGIYAFITSLANHMRFGIDSMIIAGRLSLAVVTHYNIAVRLVEYLMLAIGSLVGVMTPVFTQLHATGDYEALRRQFLMVSRIGVVLGVLGAGFIIIYGGVFIELWLGPEYLDAYIPMVILVVAMTIDAMQIPTVNALFATARHRFFAWMTLGDGLVNLFLSLLLVGPFGMTGVALGTLIPMLVTKLVIQPVYVCRVLGLRLGTFYREVFGLALALSVLQAPIYLLRSRIDLDSFLDIALWGGAGGVAVMLAAYTLLLHRDERDLLHRFVARKEPAP